jgi:arabinogalactan oligomer / maltooligosaccharide transport system substrate-binding protein
VRRARRRPPRPRLAGLGGLAAAALATLLAACTTPAPPHPSQSPSALTGHLVWWDTATATGAAAADRAIVDGFRERYPGVAVDVRVMSPDDARTRFDTAAQSTAGAPDVITVDSSWVPEWGYRGYLASLEDTPAQPAAQDVFPSLVSTETWDGRLVVAARSADPMVLLYNPRLLARSGVRVPHTWQEISEARLRLTAQGVQTLYAPGTGDGLLPWTYGAGGSLLDTHAKLILVDEPASVAGLADRASMQATGVVVDDSESGSVDRMRTMFRNGKVAMILDYSSALPLLVGGPAFASQTSIGITPVPAGSHRSSGPVTTSAYGVYSGSKSIEAAFLFVAYAASVESQATLSERIGLLPTRPPAYDLAAVKQDRVVSAFQPAVESGTPLPQVQVQSALLPPLGDALRRVVAGDASPQAALSDVATAYEKLLSGFTTGPAPSG